MPRYIENLNECTDPVSGDYLWIVDASAGSTDKDRRVNVGKFAQVSTGTWTPVIMATSSNPSVTYTERIGRYTRLGDIVFFDFVVLINTISGGSGALLILLPVTANGNSYQSVILYLANVNLPANYDNVVGTTMAGQSYMILQPYGDQTAETSIEISALTNGSKIRGTGWYYAS